MRSVKSLKNVIFGWGMQILIILLGFVSRTVFIDVLGEEYLGISGLFANILTMLSLAELGIGTAIVFSLYKPIAEQNREQIIALMGFYQKFYRGVGCFVLIFGTALAPFLPHLVKEMPDIPHIYLIYLLYVVNTGVSYFYSYKTAFVNANQENFLVSLNHGICYTFMVGLQIGVLLVTRDFIAYFAVQIGATLAENIIISRIADRRYPFLRSREKYKIDPAISKQIKTNTVAMIGHNLGGIVMGSTDNLIISKFVGIVEVGLYSNYQMIINAVQTVLNQAFTAITSSVGNLLVLGDEKQKEDTFYMVFFVGFWLFGFCATALFCLSNPFIEIWVGERFLYGMPIVAVLAAKFYCTGVRQACITFKCAAGLYMQDVYKPYVEVGVNLVISLILVKRTGILGVFLGTLITTLLVTTWIEPVVLFRYEFQKGPWKYFGKYIWYGAVMAGGALLTYWFCAQIPAAGVGGFALKLLVVAVVPNVVYFLMFFWTGEFRLLVRTLKNAVGNVPSGKKNL